ncbi:MAG: FAD-binding oxidoreductase [Actinomycetota bacterium]|nr:MAG: FAD-binding oxidoreductase [Actinomycetota bacterium]
MTTEAVAEPWRAYAARVEALRQQYDAIPAGTPVRLAKRTSNLFRARQAAAGPGLDVAAFDGVLAIDPVARTADVQGMTTYEHLVAATLPHGLVPLCVPQLKTITLGGAVTGLGIESASFRAGLPHESVLEMDVLTADGEVRTVSGAPDDPHRGLFFGFANSYGTLGYALRLRIELEPVEPYVQLRHLRLGTAAELAEVAARITTEHSWDGVRVDFMDGTVFGPHEQYLTLGTKVAVPPPATPTPSDYTGGQIYYRSIQQRSEDLLTISDYLWRWDTDWFWCSRAFGAQHPVVRRLWPKSRLRSDTYWKLVALDRRYGVSRRLDAVLGRPEREFVVQDIEVPASRLAEFLEFFHREIGMRPVWVCPLRQRDPSAHWPLYQFDPHETYVNVGFWGTVPLPRGVDPASGRLNRRIEQVVTELGGRKSLYSSAFYGRDEFAAIYGGDTYASLKKTYDPDGRLLDLYGKCVESR